ncbi:hypothetical protein JVU11DRAFT_6021 [Chiua virens]|nr:hypothetical protein JVU11DRAFT_6021 [Chiua virens]
MLRLTSLFPSSSLGDTFDGESKQPRKAYQRQPAPPETTEQSTLDLNHDSESTSATKIPIEEAEVHIDERYERTITPVGEQDGPSISFPTTLRQQRREWGSLAEVGVQRKTSFYRERNLPRRPQPDDTQFTNNGSLEDDVEQWNRASPDLSIASIQIEKLEHELALARNELQAKASVIDERDRTILAMREENGELGSLRDQLRDELTHKHQDVSSLVSEVEEWKQLGATKIGELETTSKDLERLRGELDAASSELRTTVQELTSARNGLKEWERSDAVKSKELATASSRIIELEQHDKTQSMELDSLRKQLAAISSLSENRDHTVASLNEQIDCWKLADHAKAEEIIALRKDLDQLCRDLTASADQALKDRQHHEAESMKLISQVEECGLSEATKAKELAAVHEQLQQLQHDLSTSSSLVTKLQQQDEMLSTELTSIRERLQVVSSSGDDKDRTIASLAAKIKECKQLDVAKMEELDAALRDVDRVRLDIALEQRHAAELAKELSEAQEKTQQLAKKLSSLRNRFQVALSSIEEKDGIIATHIAEIEQLKHKVAAQVEELIATCNDLEQLRRDSITNQERHVATSAELTARVEEWKRTDAAKAEKLSAAHRDLEQLRSNLATSITQIADAQRRHTTESAALASELEELKHLNSTKAQDLTTAREKIASLENQQSTSSSRIIEFEQHDKSRSAELGSLREQLAAMSSVGKDRDRAVATLNEQIAKWKRADGRKAAEIIGLRKELDELRRGLAASTDQITEEQRRHATESADLTSRMEKWKGSDAAKVQELIDVREQFAQLQQVSFTSSSRIVELDEQNQTLSATLNSLRAQCETASSYGEERDRIVANLSAEIGQWKLADVARGEELTVTRNELDQVRHALSTSLTQAQEDQRGHEVETAELVSKLEEWERSDVSKAQELSSAYGKIEQLEHNESTSSSLILELQQRDDTLSMQLRFLQDQLEAMSSLSGDRDRTVATLNKQIEHWKLADGAKAEELIVARQDLEQLRKEVAIVSSKADAAAKELTAAQESIDQLRRDLAVSSAHIVDDQERHMALSAKLAAEVEEWKAQLHSLREQLEAVASVSGGRDRTVSKLNAQIEQWKGADAGKAEELIVLRKELDQLRRDLAASVDQIAKDQRSHATESAELTYRVEEWEHSCATKADELVVARHQLEQLQNDMSTSSSLVSELQQRCEILSAELTSLREELKVVSSNDVHKDLTIVQLTTEIETKTEELGIAQKDLDRLRLDVTNGKHYVEESAKELASALERINRLSTGLDSLRDRFQVTSSSMEEKDCIIATQNIEIEKWQSKYTAQTEEFVTTGNDLEQLRSNLAASITQIADAQRRHATESAALASELEELKHLNSTKAQDLTTAREKIASLENQQSTSSSRIIEFEQHDKSRSAELGSLREQLAAMSSVGKDRDRAVATLNEQIAKWKRADGRKAAEIIGLRKELDEFRRGLAASTDQIAEEQRRRATESADLTSRMEKWKGSDAAKVQELIDVREQFAQLQQLNTTSSSRITELDQQILKLSATIDSLRAQYEKASSYGKERDCDVANLSAEIEQRKLADINKGEELTVTRNELDQARHALSTSLTQTQENEKLHATEIAELASKFEEWERSDVSKTQELSSAYERIDQLERRNETQSEGLDIARRDLHQLRLDQQHHAADSAKELTLAHERIERSSAKLNSLHEVLQAASSSIEEKNGMIATHIAEIEQLKLKDAAQAEELIATRHDLEQLRRDLIANQERHSAKSAELTAQVEEWKRSDAAKVEKLSTAHRDLEQLRSNLATSATQIADVQQRYTTVSAEYTFKLEEWKRSDTTKSAELAATRETIMRLERDQSMSSSLIIELEQRNKTQSAQLDSLHGQLETITSLSGNKDRAVTALKAQIEHWKLSDAGKAEELTMVRKELDKLQCDLVASTNQIVEDHKRHTTELTELTSRSEDWERSATDRAKELAAVSNVLEQLRHDLAVSSAQTLEDQQRHASESANLTSQIDQWKLSDAAKAEELVIADEKLKQFHRDLSTSSSHLTEFQQRCEVQLTQLDSLRQQLHDALALGEDRDHMVATLKDQLEQWKGADSARLEKLRRARAELEEIWRKLLATPTMKEPTPDGKYAT